MNIYKIFSATFWLLPFISFFAGYQLISNFYATKTIQTPNLVGLTVHNALIKLSALNLNPRILTHKEVLDLPDGTVLSQIPESTTQIRSHQTVLLVLSKKATELRIPDLTGKNIDQITSILKPLDITYTSFPVPSNAPAHTCFASFIAEKNAGMPTKIIVYVSAPTNKPIIIPNFKGKDAAQVREFLDEHQIDCSFVHAHSANNHVCSNQCIVVDQRPLAGSFVDLDQHKITVQLQVA